MPYNINLDSNTEVEINAFLNAIDNNSDTQIINVLQRMSSRGYSNNEISLILNEYTGYEISEDAISNTLENLTSPERNNVNKNYDEGIYTKDTILGLPFKFGTYADPRNRVFNSTFMADGGIVSIIPGSPQFRGAGVLETNDGGFFSLIKDLFDKNDDKSVMEIFESNFLNTDEKILKWLQVSQKNNTQNGDFRYYRFRDDYLTFLKYLDLNISTLAIKMGLTKDPIKDFFKEEKPLSYLDFMSNTDEESFAGISHAFKFYCTKSGSSTNESINNDFGPSQIAGTLGGLSDTVQELKFLMNGTFSGGNVGDKLSASVKDMVNGLFDAVGGKNNLADNLLGGTISAAAGGNKLIWPNIWKDSSFHRSYNFSFDFVSPYGTPEAIFRYVYLPFIILLTLASPKQDGTGGYSSPFLIRIDIPGYCTSDLAVIQNMSWRKGGNDGLYTNDGLPLSMSVELTVQDLYPNVAMSGAWRELRFNTGMHGFLDNMAGLSIQRFDPYENLRNSLKIRSTNILGGIKRNTIGRLTSAIYAAANSSIFGNVSNK